MELGTAIVDAALSRRNCAEIPNLHAPDIATRTWDGGAMNGKYWILGVGDAANVLAWFL